MKICGNLIPPLPEGIEEVARSDGGVFIINRRLPQTAGSYRLLSAPHRYWNKEDPHGFRCHHTALRRALKSKSSG